jgi:hypothetical protein
LKPLGAENKCHLYNYKPSFKQRFCKLNGLQNFLLYIVEFVSGQLSWSEIFVDEVKSFFDLRMCHLWDYEPSFEFIKVL